MAVTPKGVEGAVCADRFGHIGVDSCLRPAKALEIGATRLGCSEQHQRKGSGSAR